ncbi:MAG: hypothetical protein ACTH2Y_03215 [Corynebacterium sp.]|uniref:hypothetical protein n=1 Tax=unclassified Corynebacterium TaxID=2624378 RepID=UPI0026524899|nr:hypothetical protein [Corynebacterium sp.]MDN6259002.1 hypothetical protein [Corynebacterium sp.]MDN6509549.1 hypothetical protein [Corynebacterium sp.]
MTDGIEQWVLDLPLWLQTPLVLIVLVLVASVIAVVLMKVAFGLLPLSHEERQAFGPADGPSGETREERQKR